MPKKAAIRSALVILILSLTFVLFFHYFKTHPEEIRSLKQVSPWVILWVLVLNAIGLAILVCFNAACLALCGKFIHWRENFLLTSYSSLANFFGPLQSGPAVRATYLKTKHKVRLRDYTLASLIGLGFFALWSALFLFVGTRPWWQTIGSLLFVFGGSWLVISWFLKRDKHPKESQFQLRKGVLLMLLLLTFLQVSVAMCWYYVELHAVYNQVTLAQAMSYTGAANFSLFVSITPDAIGIREAFLVFSQHIHHVPTAAIVQANVIDRVSYVIFLLMLALVVASMHAKKALGITKLRRSAASTDGQ